MTKHVAAIDGTLVQPVCPGARRLLLLKQTESRRMTAHAMCGLTKGKALHCQILNGKNIKMSLMTKTDDSLKTAVTLVGANGPESTPK